MKLEATVLAVKNLEVSKQFYMQLFDQKIILDHGLNITFDGGFALQKDFAWLVDVPSDWVCDKACNMELYFEVDDFDKFIKKLETYPNIKYVHPIKKYNWEQRVVRIFDPDNHMIEIGEAMDVVITNLLLAKKDIDEVSRITQYPIDYVRNIFNKL